MKSFGHLLKLIKIAMVVVVTATIAVWISRQMANPLLETVTFSKKIVDRDGHLLRLTLSGDERYRLYTKLHDIHPSLIEAVLLHEDRWFRFHPGVNPWSLVKAFGATYVYGSRRMGGSTITMQLARMTSTESSKTVLGKIHQVGRALWFEIQYSKDEILEAYLNLLPFGGNVEGVSAASLVYFGKSSKDLSIAEIMSLAVIPQNPNIRGADRTQENSAFAKARTALFHSWVARHQEDQSVEVDIELPLLVGRIDRLPFKAPHFVNLALERTRNRPWRETSTIQTTLESSLQALLERKVRDYVNEKSRLRVSNAAAMIVDTESMDVLAEVGSVDFFNEDIDGQVNGTTAKRSPGSALKPMTYALALDQGLIHPLSLLKDTPMSFGAFDPENFDRGFEGPLTATDALVNSRNVPAVYLASQLKKPSLYEFVRSAGVQHLRDEKYYGLALTLGGAEVTMEELISLYAGLANHGLFAPVRVVKSEDSTSASLHTDARRLLSKEASFLTLEMLTHNARDGQKLLDGWTRDSVPIAWKTGTSHGFRDAWTAGLIGKYAIVVWFGNFDGEGNPAFIGRDLAAPLFFRVADALRGDRSTKEPKWLDTRELNIKQVDVCSISGQIPGAHCHHHLKTWFIPGKSPIASCSIHRQIGLTMNGLRACDETHVAKNEVFEFWPTDLLQLFRRAGIPRRSPPPFESGCNSSIQEVTGLAPQITSPRTLVSYSLRVAEGGDTASQEGVPLIAVADADARTLHWFIDADYVGKTDPQKPLMWKPRPGHFVVRVLDDLGRSDSRALDVEVTR